MEKIVVNCGRQGDVYLERIDKLPSGVQEVPRENGRIILAYGEVTGHAHAIVETGAIQYALENDRFLDVQEIVHDVHEEHATLTITPGFYRVKIQQQYTPEAITNAFD